MADIGFPPDLVRSDLTAVRAPRTWRDLARVRAPDTHKRAAGVVLVLAGSPDDVRGGHPVPTAAYRAGAGLVTLAVPQSVLPVVESAITEATFLPLPESREGSVSADAWPLLAERLDAVDALAIGPGLSTDPSTVALVRRVVAHSPVPFVLDADGLNAFRRRSPGARGPPIGGRPHAARRRVRPADRPVRRGGHARQGRARPPGGRRSPLHGAAEGQPNVVAEPGGRATVNPTGTAALATGGPATC